MVGDPIGVAVRILDDVAEEVTPAVHWPTRGRLRDVSFAGAERRAALGREMIARIDALADAPLPPSLRQTLGCVRLRAEYWIVQPDWYWTVFDPAGGEMFAMFAPTPYCLGMIVASLDGALARAPLGDEAARGRFLAALHEYGDLLDALAERTRGQAERGVLMPRAQAEAARRLLAALRDGRAAALAVSGERAGSDGAFVREAAGIVERRLGGALARHLAIVGDDYLSRTRDAVGLAACPDGEAVYRALVRLHGSTERSPEEIHALGLARMAVVHDRLREACDSAGFAGDIAAYRAHLDVDPAWRAGCAKAIRAVFERYVERFRPHVDRLFNVRPRAPYGVRPLPDALSGAMTFGYYDPPTAANPRGDYVFNAANLARSSLCTVASLNYHELVPGHHLHLALQSENEALPAVRQWCMPTAYVEGWAEYAVTLAEEQGMFEHPAERFGRYCNEAFLTARLVVDTGMNALGWSLERARAYLRDEALLPAPQADSETLRYAADLPAQALAYKLGERGLLDLRAEMHGALGEAFDVRDFHDAVLTPGAMPLPLLAEHVRARTAELTAGVRR